ncbi:PhnD/SsuA/transferrin family substrate-binding protein [Duganella sp. FT80W]|uniref:PhnD/SsuA/transferrin family substrate-binding protein n=1 Tax=Duganella guangzhouensis TaxID=2666084 RepID=A0A6I2KXE1_9BURK|nr:PhnD/SsuA/transferrin family substrate-binding protein [Duganella guangzhouensis]MRW90461.1 PhnD/SsuA/transferrin family substrate-binding protein [Duganella guangzhouensis]
MNWKVALPMYNVSPRLQRGYETLLERLLADAGVRAELVAPSDLPAFWRRDDVLLTQTCGYPYVTMLADTVRLVATPCFDFPGCDGSDYSSLILARTASGVRELEQARGRVVAVNEAHSNSGMNVLRHAVAPLARDGRFFGEVKWSGSHVGSMRMLRAGEADLAAIDCVTYGYLRAETPGFLCGTKVVGRSASSPGLPLVASRAVPDELVAALRAALLSPSEALLTLMQEVRINAFEYRTDADYERIRRLEAEAVAAGYPQIA